MFCAYSNGNMFLGYWGEMHCTITLHFLILELLPFVVFHDLRSILYIKSCICNIRQVAIEKHVLYHMVTAKRSINTLHSRGRQLYYPNYLLWMDCFRTSTHYVCYIMAGTSTFHCVFYCFFVCVWNTEKECLDICRQCSSRSLSTLILSNNICVCPNHFCIIQIMYVLYVKISLLIIKILYLLLILNSSQNFKQETYIKETDSYT